MVGADPNIKNVNGHTAFDLALAKKRMGAAEFLLPITKGAKIEIDN